MRKEGKNTGIFAVFICLSVLSLIFLAWKFYTPTCPKILDQIFLLSWIAFTLGLNIEAAKECDDGTTVERIKSLMYYVMGGILVYDILVSPEVITSIITLFILFGDIFTIKLGLQKKNHKSTKEVKEINLNEKLLSDDKMNASKITDCTIINSSINNCILSNCKIENIKIQNTKLEDDK